MIRSLAVLTIVFAIVQAQGTTRDSTGSRSSSRRLVGSRREHSEPSGYDADNWPAALVIDTSNIPADAAEAHDEFYGGGSSSSSSNNNRAFVQEAPAHTAAVDERVTTSQSGQQSSGDRRQFTSVTSTPRRGATVEANDVDDRDEDDDNSRDRSQSSGSRREFTPTPSTASRSSTRPAGSTSLSSDETSVAENRDSGRRRTTLPASVGAIDEGGYDAVESRLVNRLRNFERANRLSAAADANDGRPQSIDRSENVGQQNTRDRQTSPRPTTTSRDVDDDADNEQTTTTTTTTTTRRPLSTRRPEFTSRTTTTAQVEEANDGYDAPAPVQQVRTTTRPRPRTAANRDANENDDDNDEFPTPRSSALAGAAAAEANDYEGGARRVSPPQVAASRDSDEETTNATIVESSSSSQRRRNESADEPLADENLDRTTLTIARLLSDNALNALSRRDAAKLSPLKTAKKVRIVHLPPIAETDGSEEIVLVGQRGNATVYRGRNEMFVHASRVVRRH